MVDRQKQQPIREYELYRTKFDGTAALGIPMYKPTGDTRHFTGTNREANDFRRRLDDSEHETGIRWSFRDAT
jgi:hypothetical protein